MKPEDFAKKLDEIMDELINEATSKESMQELGDEAANLIRKRTRLGYGVESQGGTKARLAPLTEKYQKVRK
jgi:hypothetical protein